MVEKRLLVAGVDLHELGLDGAAQRHAAGRSRTGSGCRCRTRRQGQRGPGTQKGTAR